MPRQEPVPSRFAHRARRLALAAVAAATLCGLMLTGSGARATSVQAMTLPELVAEATVVVVAQATRAESRWAAGGKAIVTDVEVQVEEVVLGTVKPGSSLLVTHLGGRMGDVALRVPGAPRLKPGQRGLMFLTDKGDGMRFVGFHQGLMKVYRDGDVERVAAAVPDAHQVTRDATGKLQPAEAPVADHTALTDLIARGRELAGKR